MKKKVLSLNAVSVGYKTRNRPFSKTKTILKDISFDIFSHETIGVYGGNGAGKSTLLSVIAGVMAPDSGQIETFGSTIALLNLNLGLDNALSGKQNIFLHGLFLGFKPSEIKKKIDSIIHFSELKEFIDEPVYTYSSGMKARLGFSTVYQLNTDLILIDEMLGVGDQHFKRKSNYALKQKIKSNQTVVLVSHNIKQLKHLSDRIIVLEGGKIKDILSAAKFDLIPE
ncbi:ABC transporter ATP-binding protein [Desulfogranum marinum]|uniref:ABC transporter ATP-binding protein n=1 Tax=Desulfogranum marinum TaxID=453220 RepID=UPI0019632780|nr:ATP-binding cassette domain-containing protein [Desulfogranum marinum]MBM9513031.1 ATP-binding cassette domain-containing protein [Desulfogranum marinum]